MNEELLFFQITILLVLFSALANAADLDIRQGRRPGRRQLQGRRPGRRQFQGRRTGGRQFQGRQNPGVVPVEGGVDFSGCVNDRDSGLCCVEREETITTIKKV